MRPSAASAASIARKRRVNLRFAARSAASGSTRRWRARFAITNIRSPYSSSHPGRVAGVARLDQLGRLLGDLGQNGAGVGPVEAHAGGAILQLDRAGQRRQAGGDAVERARSAGLPARSAALIRSQSAVC